HLVQNAFFPDNDITLAGMDIAAFYTPASECGGDWWGHLSLGDKTAIFIADATGHGVPAALLTATANSSVSIIGQLAEHHPELLESPAKMMSLINQAVCNVGNQILMTFFIAVFDKNTNQIIYSNASHNPPLKVEPIEGTYEKRSFRPLLGENGPHLGKDPKANYKDETVEFKGDHSLIMFTDGIIECANSEKKQWGERRFLKSLLSHMADSPAKLRDSVVKEAYEFYGGEAPDDDITLLVIKPSSSEKKAIGHSTETLRFSDFSIYSTSFCPHLPTGISNTAKDEANILIVDSSQLDQKETLELIAKYKQNTIVISDKQDDENITNCIAGRQINHVIGSNGLQLQKELHRTLTKISTQKHWGLEQYMSQDDPLYLVEIKDSLNANEDIEALLDRVDMGNFFSSPKNFLLTISNEMVTNALFSSTNNQDTDRTGEIHLKTDQTITFKIGKFDNNLILSVTDNSGTLTKEIITNSLLRSAREKTPEQKEGGAGLGMYMIYSFTNQLIFNIAPGKKTEVICIIEDTKRYKQFRNRITSFHYYEDVT
ncbi:MAG: SpoIIE family protein phosphatase, partial [Halobacteriovoraceae bacterium]|nr:SpoIIE family protein phosphatase [Halobacteriovoraceae bacterium]